MLHFLPLTSMSSFNLSLLDINNTITMLVYFSQAYNRSITHQGKRAIHYNNYNNVNIFSHRTNCIYIFQIMKQNGPTEGPHRCSGRRGQVPFTIRVVSLFCFRCRQIMKTCNGVNIGNVFRQTKVCYRRFLRHEISSL